MTLFNRRRFFETSLGLAAGSIVSSNGLFGEDVVLSSNIEFAPSTLFLTWRRDPTTTILIQWIAQETATDKSIHFHSLDGRSSGVMPTVLKPFPETNLKVHRCELTDLIPGTEYAFHIGAGSTVYRFRTMPARATDVFQWVSGGDAGIDFHAVNSNILAASQEPQFALIGGDLAYDNGKSPQTVVLFLENYNRYMVDPQRRIIPLLACAGNHEVDGGYAKTRVASPQFLSLFDGLFSETSYGVLDFGDYLSLVLLDTNHISPIKGEQTYWLEGVLRERQEKPHLIVANHVPAYPAVRNPNSLDDTFGTGELNRIHWSPLFERYNVDLVLEHHDHVFKRTHPLVNGFVDRYGVLYLGDGSWGKIRALSAPELRPYLAKVSEAYHITVHRLEGDQRFHTALADSGRIADVCATTSKRPARRG